MKAKDIEPGMTVNGIWTAVSVFEVCGVMERRVDENELGFTVTREADPWNTLVMVELERGIPDPATFRTWFRADEEVEL